MNMYVPFDFKIKDINSGSIVLSWDVHNVAEYAEGTYYKLYVKNGAAWEYLIQANITYIAIPKPASLSEYAVSSVYKGLESELSAPLTIDLSPSSTDSRDATSVAVDINGAPAKLVVDENGSLKTTATLSASNINVVVSGGATELKQNDIIAKLDELVSKIESMADASAFSLEHTVSNVTPDGVTFFLPVKHKSKISRITVLQEFGAATQFKVELTNTSLMIAERNIVLREFSAQQYDSKRIDVIREFVFMNKEGQDLMGVRLTPDVGTSNIFYICITGLE